MKNTAKTLSIPMMASSLIVLSTDALATEMTVSIEIPRINVAEYHRPYVAAWIEDASGKNVANLSVWFMQKNTSEGAGSKWLPDMRQWWRKGGRDLKVPVDGITGPTRPAGRHQVKANAARMARVPAGKYTVVVESVREVGGRELVRIPITIAPGKSATGRAAGKSELGAVSVTVSP